MSDPTPSTTVNSAMIWLIDDDASIRRILQLALEAEGHTVKGLASADNALQALAIADEHYLPDLIFCDIQMPGVSGLDFLETLKAKAVTIPVIIMTAYSDLEATVNAYSAGAYDYLSKPFDIHQATDLTQQVLAEAQTQREAANASPPATTSPERMIIGQSTAMQEVYRIIGRLHNSTMNVLVTGETGTGKELVARALHQNSPRAKQPFIAINTAAIPRDLLESELFGHEKGAFTGASGQRKGRFEQANGGTLFLDEIGDMPLELQTRLLRVLAEGEFYRVGGHQPVRVDVRVIAATHQDLEQLSQSGKFREDLYHRLNVIRLALPPLRDRHGDIALLMRHYIERIAAEFSEPAKQLSEHTLTQLSAYHWPGNVRQLENVIRSVMVMTSGHTIQVADLPMGLLPDWGLPTHATSIATPDTKKAAASATIHAAPQARVHQPSTENDTWQALLAAWIADALTSNQEEIGTTVIKIVEQILIDTTLAHTNGRRQVAAKHLGWGRNTLTRKIQQLSEDNADLDNL